MIHEKTVNTLSNNRTLKWVAVFFYASLIFFLSSLSSPPDVVPPFFMFDKVLHFGEYGILGFLLFNALVEESWAKKPVFAAFILGVVYGISDEFHQYFVPSREADLLDLLADAAGSGAGAFTASLIIRRGRFE